MFGGFVVAYCFKDGSGLRQLSEFNSKVNSELLVDFLKQNGAQPFGDWWQTETVGDVDAAIKMTIDNKGSVFDLNPEFGVYAVHAFITIAYVENTNVAKVFCFHTPENRNLLNNYIKFEGGYTRNSWYVIASSDKMDETVQWAKENGVKNIYAAWPH